MSVARLIEIREQALSVSEALGAVEHTAAGGIALFVGCVRNENEGRPVTLLEYEAYGPMALREMHAIAAELEQEVSGTRLAVLHRVGKLEVGDIAVVCAASAPHRGEAFTACRRLIDRIKERVPIWKREHGPDGPHWVGWQDARCAPDDRHGH
jgi:molybdopterin synthase catalytic subunit